MKPIRRITEGIWDLVYPRRCPVCDGLLQPGDLICPDCAGKIHEIGEPVCKKCGKPLEQARQEYCGDCKKKKHSYTQGKAVFLYEGKMRESLYRFKYAGRREYAGFYADRAAAHYADWLVRHQVEAILPVPMYRPKQRLRGYNQAEEFARALGRKTGIPVDTKMVRRIRNTVPLKNLNPTERQRNLKSAFQFGTDIVKYNQIVLTDDIYTTGSTVDEIARVLRAAGVREIYYICVSIGSGY